MIRVMRESYGDGLLSTGGLWPICGYKEQVAYGTSGFFLVHGEAKN